MNAEIATDRLQVEGIGVEKKDDQHSDTDDMVVLAQQGDQHAFNALIKEFEPVVMGYLIRHLRNTTDAEDVAQEVMMTAFRKIHQVRNVKAFRGWLRVTTHNRMLNFITRRRIMSSLHKKEAKGRGDFIDSVISSNHIDQPLDILIQEETVELVRTNLANQRPIDRDVLDDFYLQGKSLKEIAGEDTPIGTVKRRGHTARARLKETLIETGYFNE